MPANQMEVVMTGFTCGLAYSRAVRSAAGQKQMTGFGAPVPASVSVHLNSESRRQIRGQLALVRDIHTRRTVLVKRLICCGR